jgi:hypothetical protein
MTRFSLFFLVFAAPFFVGCPGFQESTQPIFITGDIERDAFLYKVTDPQQPDPDLFQPIKRVFVGSSTEMPAGHYYIANECSGHAFEHTASAPTKIVMSKVQLIRENAAQPTDAPDEPLLLECTDPIDGSITRWTDKASFAVFPGDASFALTRQKFTVTSPIETSKTHEIILNSALLDGGANAPKDKYFILPETESSLPDSAKEPDSFVVSANAGKRIWLPPGNFWVEVNGTKRKFEMLPNTNTVISTGALRIDVPPAFSPEDRARKGGQPIFAFINDGVLFNLANDYLLLPGEYDINIEGSDMRRHVVIEPGKRTVIPTRVAQINVPSCPQGISCRNVSRITIHKEQRPFALMHVETGVPFVIFDEPYEYGVDGTRGVFRALAAGHQTLRPETLARIKIRWDVRPAAARTRTDLVRIESRGAPNFGRSLDLLFSKPDEIYVPAGQYALTYFVGDPSLDRPKTRVDITAPEGSTQTVVVPLYMESKQNQEDLEAEKKKAEEAASGKMPTSLSPIQR